MVVRSDPTSSGPNGHEPKLHLLSDGDAFDDDEAHRLSEDIDSICSTPYVSAPSSPGRSRTDPTGYFFSAPASPMHYVLTAAQPLASSSAFLYAESSAVSGSFEFEFSSRFSPTESSAVSGSFEFSSRFSPTSSSRNGSMTSADELFLNGQIRPMKFISHLQKPQIPLPFIDLKVEDGDAEEDIIGTEGERDQSVARGRDLRLRNRSIHRKARSFSPLRTEQFRWQKEENTVHKGHNILELEDSDNKQADILLTQTSSSASSSRSSSTGRNSKKWIFLKDLLYRSKSEGSGDSKEKFWPAISFSPSKEKKLTTPSLTSSSPFSRDEKEKTNVEAASKQKKKSKQFSGKEWKPANGVAKRRVLQSPHELHYTANRAQAEEMKKKTFLPYRQGLLGCLGFGSKGYGVLNGLTRSLSPVS